MKKESNFNQQKLLPDTNLLILGLKGESVQGEVLHHLIKEKLLALSPIVIAEFLVRAKPFDQNVLRKLTSEFRTYLIDGETAQIAAEYRREFMRKKHKSYLMDCFVAASCKQHDLILVTNNTADFPMRDIQIYTPQALLKKI